MNSSITDPNKTKECKTLAQAIAWVQENWKIRVYENLINTQKTPLNTSIFVTILTLKECGGMHADAVAGLRCTVTSASVKRRCGVHRKTITFLKVNTRYGMRGGTGFVARLVIDHKESPAAHNTEKGHKWIFDEVPHAQDDGCHRVSAPAIGPRPHYFWNA